MRALQPFESRVDFAIHAATDNAVDGSHGGLTDLFETIVDGTRRAMRAAGPGCRSFLLVSSGAIYGPPRPEISSFPEDMPSGPDPASTKSAYAEGKRAAEQFGAIAAAGGLGVRIARCFAFVGPHMPFDSHFAIGNFIADAVNGRPIRIRSDGRPLRSYLYMADLVRALVTILVDGAIGRPYNVGSDVAVSIEQLAHRVNRIAGGHGVVIRGVPSDPADRYLPNVSRLRNELGFKQEISLDDAIERTAAWYRANAGASMTSSSKTI